MPAWLNWETLADARQWLTFVFAAIAAWIGWTKFREERRTKRSEAGRAWSLIVRQRHIEPGVLMSLRLENPEGNRFHLVNVRIVRPRGFLVAKPRLVSGPKNEESRYEPDEGVQLLKFERDIDADYRLGGGVTVLPYSSANLFVLPARGVSRARAEIEVTVEDRSSSRRESRFIVKSQPIDWSISKNAMKK